MGICWDAGTIMHWGRFLRETPFYIDKHTHAHSNTLAMLSHLTLLTSAPKKTRKWFTFRGLFLVWCHFDVSGPKKGMKSGSYETAPWFQCIINFECLNLGYVLMQKKQKKTTEATSQSFSAVFQCTVFFFIASYYGHNWIRFCNIWIVAVTQVYARCMSCLKGWR